MAANQQLRGDGALMMPAWRRRLTDQRALSAPLLSSGALSAGDRPIVGRARRRHHPRGADAAEARLAAPPLTDRQVITQTAKIAILFRRAQGRIVVVTLFFAGCTGVCPVNNEKLAELQRMLGNAMGRDVFFVSVSVDPEHDTVEVLAQYAAKLSPRARVGCSSRALRTTWL